MYVLKLLETEVPASLVKLIAPVAIDVIGSPSGFSSVITPVLPIPLTVEPVRIPEPDAVIPTPIFFTAPAGITTIAVPSVVPVVDLDKLTLEYSVKVPTPDVYPSV